MRTSEAKREREFSYFTLQQLLNYKCLAFFNLTFTVCLKQFFQIFDDLFYVSAFKNEEGLYDNYYLHVWQTYAICPFANAVIFATAKPKPATAISVSDVSVVVDSTATATVTLTPADATSELEFISDDESVFTVSSLGVVTGVSAGTGTLTVKTDNGLSDDATVTVSAGE